jgi:hypothetical protein
MSETVNTINVTYRPHTLPDLNSGIHLRTRIYILVGDLDVASGYPNGTCVFNTSRETTSKEIVGIEGVPEHVWKMEGLNLSGGFTNAVYYATQMYQVPTLFEMDDFFREGIIPQEKPQFEYSNYHLRKKSDKDLEELLGL